MLPVIAGGLSQYLGGPLATAATIGSGSASRVGAKELTKRRANLARALVASGRDIPIPSQTSRRADLTELLMRQNVPIFGQTYGSEE